MVRLALLLLAATPPSGPLLDQASVHGKYERLLGRFTLPGDVDRYGPFHDFGYWKGGPYETLKDTPAGYWVYVVPDWYVWEKAGLRVPPAKDSEHRAFDPFAPAVEYLREQGFSGADLKPADRALGEFSSMIRLADGRFAIGSIRDDRTEAAKHAADRDGYAAYVADRRVPLISLIDSTGGIFWEHDLSKKGFVDYGAPVLAEAKDGRLFVIVPSYVGPARMAVARVMEVDRVTSKVLWERQLRGSGDLDSPSVQKARITERGTLALEGHIYHERGVDGLRGWRGEVGPDGKLLEDRDGPLRPGLGPITFDEREQAALLDGVTGPPVASRPAYLFASKERIALAERQWHLSPLDGRLVPVAVTGTGWVVAGVRDDGTPVVVATNPRGEPLWERALAPPGLYEWSGGLAAQAPDGTVLLVLRAFRGWEATLHVVALSKSGEVLWDRPPKVSPELEHANLTPQGTLVLRGFVYRDADCRKLHTWEGELDLTGHWLRDAVGGPRPSPTR